MKRKANIQAAANQIKKEFEEVEKIKIKIEKLEKRMYEIKKENSWMNYLGEGFSNGVEYLDDGIFEMMSKIS